MIVLDTHIWLWWINQDQTRLKPAWIARIDGAEPVGVSAISCFEVAWLAHHGRIELPIAEDDWFDKALEGSGIIRASHAWRFSSRNTTAIPRIG